MLGIFSYNVFEIRMYFILTIQLHSDKSHLQCLTAPCGKGLEHLRIHSPDAIYSNRALCSSIIQRTH